MPRNIRRWIPGAALAAAIGLITPASMTPQEGQLDGGTFEHSVGGGFAGTETFAVRRRGEDVVAVGRVTREGGPEALRALEVGLRFDGSGRPLRYELHTREGPPLHVVVNRTGSRLRVTITADEGERFTEFLASERLVVLEREIAHHYYSLARRLREAGDPRSLDLEILVPSEGRTVPLQVRALSRDTLTLQDTRVSATRYELTVGGEETVLWLATEDGRIMRVAIPGRGWQAARVARP
ncbi:MAG: hypothetical protein KAJ13_03105 [Gemmatimonadetes bacterium]|nr:hypothetical protein [Gemmatimonadota bacterium]